MKKSNPCVDPSRQPEEEEARRTSKEIDKRLKVEWIKFERTMKLLMLGTGESGKTTIIKQIQLIHAMNGFTKQERTEKIPFIRSNVHESIYSIVNNLNKINPPLIIADNSALLSSEYILNIGPRGPSEFNDEYYDHVANLWRDNAIQTAFNRSNEYQLIDSASRFLNRIEIIRRNDYLPDDQDILYCRIETTELKEYNFSLPSPNSSFGNSNVDFKVWDVGGQRGHRKKWIQLFEGINAVLFMIACSDFDQTLREDGLTNRLKEGLEIFGDIYHCRYLFHAAMIVFLNKQDLLREKVENGKMIGNYFPEYNNYVLSERHGNSNSEYNKVKYFIHDKVQDIVNQKNNRFNNRNGLLFTHFTTAVDTDNIKLVFNSVYSSIIEINLNQFVLQ